MNLLRLLLGIAFITARPIVFLLEIIKLTFAFNSPEISAIQYYFTSLFEAFHHRRNGKCPCERIDLIPFFLPKKGFQRRKQLESRISRSCCQRVRNRNQQCLVFLLGNRRFFGFVLGRCSQGRCDCGYFRQSIGVGKDLVQLFLKVTVQNLHLAVSAFALFPRFFPVLRNLSIPSLHIHL